MNGYDAQGNFLPPQQLVDEIERLIAALENAKYAILLGSGNNAFEIIKAALQEGK